jgi:hypothetical protein
VRDDGRVGASEPERPDPIKAILQLAGLLAGVLALLYAIGGGVLALRLYFESLPSLTVVGQLPREFLISLALTQVALPTAAVAALYLTIRLVVGLRPPRKLVALEPRRSRRDWARLIAAAAGLAALATLVGAGPALLREEPGWFLAWTLLGFVLAGVVALVALELRARVARRDRDWHDRRSVAAMTGVVALAFLPMWLMSAGTFHLLDAKVCLAGDAEEEGVLVGETSDRVYIGEKGGRGPRRVVSLPLGQVEELVIGGDAAGRPCALDEPAPEPG